MIYYFQNAKAIMKTPKGLFVTLSAAKGLIHLEMFRFFGFASE